MDKTRIEQDSVEVTLADSSVVFQVTTTIIEPGILPDTGLFVFSIIDPAEPKSDEFVRVAQPHDINFMLRDRDNAIAAGNEEYLYVKVVLQYPSLEVAIQAKAAIKSRIDSAISRWYQYQTEFVGVVETLHPGVDPEYEQALRDTYVAARDARVLAETAVEDADDAVIAAQVLLDHAQEISDIRKDETGFCTVANGTLWPQLQTGLGTFNTGAGALFTASKTFWTAAKAFDTVSSSYFTSSWTFWDTIGACYNYFPGAIPPPDPLGPGTLYDAPPMNPNWADFYAALQAFDGSPGTFNTARVVFGTAVSTYGPHATPGTSLAAFQTVLDAYTTTSTLITSMDMALSTFCATVIAAYSAALVQVTQKEESVATAVNTKNEAEAELASAQETEDAALAAVQEVCPDFETTSV
jgi:hypothetical protein